jgi:NAD dependent epimerase/dehydratase family enzyme
VRVAARLLLRVEPEFALSGRRCVPRRLLAEGFRFRDTDLAATLRGLLVQKKV